jgi:hypothetical protein
MWLDSGIVPKTDENIMKLLRGHKFMPGPAEPRFWMLWIGVTLILIAFGKFVYDHFRKKGEA